MTEPEVNVEEIIMKMMANQVQRDVEWAWLTIYWQWNTRVPKWFRWVCSNRIFFWFANRYRMGWFGQWVIPPFPELTTNEGK